MNHPNIQIIKGSSPILLSAPHAVPIIKEELGVEYTKFEKRVAEIVRILCANEGAWGIYTELKNTENTLKNWDTEVYNIYKKFVREIVKKNNISLVLDIHGSKQSRPFLIDYDFIFPQMHRHDDILEDILQKNFLKFFAKKDLSKGFYRTIKGSGQKTLTYHVRKHLKIPAVQLELNEDTRQEEKNFSQLIKALGSIIKNYENITTGL